MRFLFIIITALIISSCDSGDIYPEETIYEEITVNVDASFTLNNLAAFPENYHIALGMFIGTSPYPLAFETIEKPAGNGKVNVTLDKLPKGTTYLSLALLEKVGNKQKFSFYKYPVTESTDNIVIDETINLATFSRIQEQIFTPQCAQCHGLGGKAAGLDLTAENAYANLFSVPSKEDNSNKNRVTEYDIYNSFLLDVLTEDVPTVSTNHTTLTTLDAVDDINVIKTWIQTGAENN